MKLTLLALASLGLLMLCGCSEKEIPFDGTVERVSVPDGVTGWRFFTLRGSSQEYKFGQEDAPATLQPGDKIRGEYIDGKDRQLRVTKVTRQLSPD